MHSILNMQYSQYTLFSIYTILNIQYSKYTPFPIYTIPKIRHSQYTPYPIYTIPNTSFPIYTILNIHYSQYTLFPIPHSVCTLSHCARKSLISFTCTITPVIIELHHVCDIILYVVKLKVFNCCQKWIIANSDESNMLHFDRYCISYFLPERTGKQRRDRFK